MSLNISSDLQLPLEAVTQTFGIIAKRGVGKTYTASVMAEEMLSNGLHVVIIDPIGVWWGLRSSADGQSPGLPVVIFGGEHGDIAITPEMGAKIASILIEEHIPAVIDLSLFRKAEQKRFVTAFADELYHGNRDPLHLILDEADTFAPQRPWKGDERMVGAIEDIVRKGRARGLGVTMITQRSAILNKNVLSQVEVLIALRTLSMNDIKTADAWIENHGAEDMRHEFVSSLPRLPIGTAWFWSPGWLNLFKQVKVRQRLTFDSSATPKVGELRIEPRSLADVNLQSLRSRLEPETPADEPKKRGGKQKDDQVITAMRQQIAELQAELQRQREPVVVEVPVISDETVARLEELANQAIEYGRSLIDFGESALESIQVAVRNQRPPIAQPAAKRSVPQQIAPAPSSRPVKQPIAPMTNTDDMPPSGALKILRALAQRYPTRLTRPQVGTLSGFSYKGGTFGNYLSILRKRGLIEESDGDMTVTAAGFDLLGDSIPDAPETAEELIEMWSSALPGGAATMLSFLADNYPHYFDRESLGEATGYTSSGGTFGNYMSILRRNNLIEERGRDVRANPALMIDSLN